ncbi:hypothetical protein F2Q69_00029052 [Brassica cretica]|uniref:Uncharacterized protein n=1 Tax=Brassica cretica TaxID=69181 RepID=A0A8S9S567_BRACR|nr:hypothetical protein F2Q69_00029052 [Brassica cretica]
MITLGSSLACHVALPDHGVGLDGQSCLCLIVGLPVGLSSPTLGVGRPSVMFLFDCWPVGRPMIRTVQGCYTTGGNSPISADGGASSTTSRLRFSTSANLPVRASVKACSYPSSSSGNIRAIDSTVSKTSSEAQSFPSSTRISGPSSTRPRSDIGETDHPPGSEYGSDLSGTRDCRITGAMSCLREAC